MKPLAVSAYGAEQALTITGTGTDKTDYMLNEIVPETWEQDTKENLNRSQTGAAT